MPIVFQPGASLVGQTAYPQWERRGRFWRILAVSPFAALQGPAVALPTAGPARHGFPFYVRRGRFPLRVQVDGQAMVVSGSDWHEGRENGEAYIIALVGNDAADAILSDLSSNGLSGTMGGVSPQAPGLAYQYVIETVDEYQPDLQLTNQDPGAQSQRIQQVVLGGAAYSLLDYNLPRCFDRHGVLIQNQGKQNIYVGTMGDWDVMANTAFEGEPAATDLIQPGAAIQLVIPWGVSVWGINGTGSQTSGAATVVTET